MTNERYKQIRTNKNFLHLYFQEESGDNIQKGIFDVSFQTWIAMIIGVDPNVGIKKIFIFLDKKFGYSR